MPSKKEKQQSSLGTKVETKPLANTTNIKADAKLLNSHLTVTTNTVIKKTVNVNSNPSMTLDSLAFVRDQKNELDELNSRFSNYVLGLRKRSQQNDELQKKVDVERQKRKNLSTQDRSDLENQMAGLRSEIDESAVFIEHFNLKRDEALKELATLKEKIRDEENPVLANRRQALEAEYERSIKELKDLTNRFEEIEKSRLSQKLEVDQLTALRQNLQDELHELILNNRRLQFNLRTIGEEIFLTKAVQETEKADFANEQIQQKIFYNNELDNAISDIKRDFQALLNTNKVILENAYTERIEQMKAQAAAASAAAQLTSSTPKTSIESLELELKQVQTERNAIENEYRRLLELELNAQKERSTMAEESARLDLEYSRLLDEINQLTEAIEIGKQYWFSVHFELETYRRLLDLQMSSLSVNNHVGLVNGKEEHLQTQEPAQIIQTKKTESQRIISKTGDYDFDQVQVGFVSIHNAATNCVDQPLKGWTLVRTVNESDETRFQFPDDCTLKAQTRVRVYYNKMNDSGSSGGVKVRLIATAVPAWASMGYGENVLIVLLDEKGINRAQYSESWQ